MNKRVIGRSASVLIGNRIPRDFFVTQGKGQSENAIHAGSFHHALKEAEIEMCNIVTYSSILPAIAREVKRPAPSELVHGSVMETIMAVANSGRGGIATAGIIYGWLYEPGEKKYGGIVCEYNGPSNPEQAERQLRASLDELCRNGYSHLELRDTRVITESIVPTMEYGTAIVALCFLNYEVPVLSARAVNDGRGYHTGRKRRHRESIGISPTSRR